LRIYEKTLGAEHEEVATTCSNLGELLQEKGDLAGAEEFLRRSLGSVLRDKGDLMNAEEPLGAGGNDDHHTTGGRMQVILRTELGQLVVQMFMALLRRVSAMHGNNNHHDYSCSKPIYLQEILRGQSEDKALE